VLSIGGLYLWWPRKRGEKSLIKVRIKKKGRARWRDLHAVPGIVLAGILCFFVMTGMPWSAFWGANWGFVANKIDPNAEVADPSSRVARLGDVDVFGNAIPWGSLQDGVPASGAPSMPSMPGMDHGSAAGPAPTPGAPGSTPRPFGITGIALLAEDAGMKPGFAIATPSDSANDKGETVYGTYIVTNPWPAQSKVAARTLYFDQFSGKLLGESGYKDWGAVNKATDIGVSTHMGTQFGLANRIVMTLGCVLVLWSVASGLTMWLKRRRKGSLGTPRRPSPTHLPRGLLIAAGLLTIIYPLWGASFVAVLLLDRLVIQKVGPLRRAFGMRNSSGSTTDAQPSGTQSSSEPATESVSPSPM